ncbi:hypothetical protein GLOTRDRAFT_135196 [Gloeophyllum trabeum ATCC 11539]|uniref:Myb-like domain-containing protein n=1 Tax=Gloeophyllum trabeum (strain ATCC 11539 / FP-39264 / Madison 617) TaxID=670483 RepID=S7QM46_GLOTA|nr:uncharacterized protein GLOTRDRAFT_135196 [Gloeophyllum trabeum ATCC 11539]EPQ60523.1 hypothetical protein GLOTRDRAFT_135196 [Gloeophyllum trabeum ATCC 11539]
MHPNHEGAMGMNYHQQGPMDAGLNFNPLAALQSTNMFAPQQNGFPPLMNPFPPAHGQNSGPSNGHWPPARTESPMSMQQFPPHMQQAHSRSQQHQPHMHPNGAPGLNGAHGVGPNPWLSQSQAPPGMNIASLLPVNNILTDAMRMMVPVGSSPDDEKILIRALLDSSSRNQTYRQALDSLHGVNNHASNLWKDYYLEHKHRIDDMILRRHSNSSLPPGPPRQNSQSSVGVPRFPPPQVPAVNNATVSPSDRRPILPSPSSAPPKPPQLRASSSQSDVKPVIKSVKKPTFSPAPPSRRMSSQQREREGSTVSRASSSQRRRSRTKKPASTSSSSSASVENKSYSYTSTRYVSSSANLPNLFPNYQDIKVPEPPSRSPSPPTNVIPAPGGKGNRYTPEDKAWFPLKIAWEVKRNPRITKNELLQKIEERAPHHSIQSWRAHWHNDPIGDKILATAAAQLSSSEGESGDEDADGEDDDEVAGSGSEFGANNSGSDDEDGDNLDVPTDEDVKEMGAPGESYTDADKRVLARYIASYGDTWNSMTRQEKFGPFVERHPGRSIASWAEYFRRSERDVMRCVRKYRERSKKSQSETATAKRRASDMEDGDDQRGDKRAREDAGT